MFSDMTSRGCKQNCLQTFSRVCVSHIYNTAGEGRSSRQRQEVTCYLCCRGHVIMFKSPDTVISSDLHKLSSHLRLCLHRLCQHCPVSAMSPPPPPPTHTHTPSESVEDPLLLTLLLELRRRKTTWVWLQRMSGDYLEISAGLKAASVSPCPSQRPDLHLIEHQWRPSRPIRRSLRRSCEWCWRNLDNVQHLTSWFRSEVVMSCSRSAGHVTVVYLDDVVAGSAVETPLVWNPPVHRRALGTELREPGLRAQITGIYVQLYIYTHTD